MAGSPEMGPILAAGERLADEAFALKVLPRRDVGAHKWGVGGLLVIAGGPGYIGAAALVAIAAGRSGAGIVTIAIPRGAMGAVATLVPEAVFVPLSEGDLDVSSRRAREAISAKLERSAALAVGPGMGEDDYADSLLGALFGARTARRASDVGFRRRSDTVDAAGETSSALIGGDKAAVVDADGLNWLAKQPQWWKSVKPMSLVLTPHPGEMSRLTGLSIDEIASDPSKVVRDAAAGWSQVVLLKGGYSRASDGKTTIVSTDAPVSLATAGTGDVLTGMIGALLAQGVAPLDAAGLGLYLGTSAARRVETRYGQLGLVAGDLPAAVAEEIAALERKRDAAVG